MPSKKSKPKAQGAPASRTRKPKAAPESRGLAPSEVGSSDAPGVAELAKAIETDGGTVLARYRDPFGGHGLVLAALPIGKVEPTPFQRDLSKPHAERLSKAMTAVDRFLDPIVAVRREDGQGYWTPNGLHRTQALKALGTKTVIAIVVPEREVAYRILALNTEKAHTLREKALEVIRMARDLAALDSRKELEHGVTFEDPVLLTLGLAYEERPRFAGSVYQPVLRRVETFLDEPLSTALESRKRRVATLFELDDLVAAIVEALEARGLESPYLKAFVVARVNPLRFAKVANAPFDATLSKMIESAKAFDAAKIRADHVARSGGPPPGAE